MRPCVLSRPYVGLALGAAHMYSRMSRALRGKLGRVSLSSNFDSKHLAQALKMRFYPILLVCASLREAACLMRNIKPASNAQMSNANDTITPRDLFERQSCDPGYGYCGKAARLQHNL